MRNDGKNGSEDMAARQKAEGPHTRDVFPVDDGEAALLGTVGRESTES